MFSFGCRVVLYLQSIIVKSIAVSLCLLVLLAAGIKPARVVQKKQTKIRGKVGGGTRKAAAKHNIIKRKIGVKQKRTLKEGKLRGGLKQKKLLRKKGLRVSRTQKRPLKGRKFPVSSKKKRTLQRGKLYVGLKQKLLSKRSKACLSLRQKRLSTTTKVYGSSKRGLIRKGDRLWTDVKKEHPLKGRWPQMRHKPEKASVGLRVKGATPRYATTKVATTNKPWWFKQRRRIIRRYKSTKRDRLFKVLRRLSGKGYRDRKDFFKLRLFGRKALSYIYGNLSLRNFKHLYFVSRKHQSRAFHTAFFFNLIRRVDVLLNIFHFVPTVFIARECVRQGLVFVSGPRYSVGHGFKIDTFHYYVKTFESVHFYMWQGTVLFVTEFYHAVVRRPFFFLNAVAEISWKLTTLILLPFTGLEILFNKRLRYKKTRWFVRAVKQRYSFLHTFRYLWLISSFNPSRFNWL